MPEELPDPPVVRVIPVKLIAKTNAELALLQKRTGMNEHTLINRAISWYEFADAEWRAGAILTVHKNGRTYEIKTL